MVMKKSYIILLAALLCAAIFSGCSSADQPSGASYVEGVEFDSTNIEYSEELFEQMNAITSVLSIFTIEVQPTLGMPYYIDLDIESADGKTTLTISGTYTDEGGDTVPYNEQHVFDFELLVMPEIVTNTFE